MDGFVPRRTSRGVGRGNESTIGNFNDRPNIGRFGGRPTITSKPEPKPIPASDARAVSRREVDASLAQIHEEEGVTPKPRRGLKRIFGRKKTKKPLTRKQKIIKRSIIAVMLILVLIGGYVAIKAFLASNQVFQGNIFDILQNKPLKMDANGRTNIVVFGTSEDDPGHEGALLTDSIMLVSVDQNKHNAYLLSIPRDLWVDYGRACNSGFAGRVNEVYSCNSGDGKDERAGATALQKKIGEVAGLETHYYAHMNYSVLRDAVDAVGGVSVVIDSDDPRGIYDDNFDWMCQYKCRYVKYKNGPTGNMNGEYALALARARGASGNTYGLAGANFDREKYQRKILVALKDKAASAGTLTNVGKVTGLIDAMGNNLRTNFQTAEIRTLMDIGTKTPSDEIRSLLLNDKEQPLVQGTMINGASVLIPSAGQGDFSAIHAYVRKSLSSDPVAREEANVVVLNGTTTMGLAQEQADLLTGVGYTVTETGNAPTTAYKNTKIYRITTEGTSGTAKALKKRYNVEITNGKPSFAVAEGTDFVVIIGDSSAGQSEQ